MDELPPHFGRYVRNQLPRPVNRACLEEHVWWWNWKILGHRQQPSQSLGGLGIDRKMNRFFDFQVWNDSESRIAWSYELMMRYDRNIHFPAFYDLNGDERRFLREVFDPGEPPYREVYETINGDDEAGWTPRHSRPQWNLRKSDRALVKAFKSYIAQHRKGQGITTPKKNKGRKQHKSPIWKSLEILDINYYRLESFEESERSQLSKTKRKASAYYLRFSKHLEKVRRGDFSCSGCFASLILHQ